jgi:hypothetical protein
MKIIRSLGMHTDHDYHGRVIETSRVDLYVDESVTPEQIEILKLMQEKRLRAMAKAMPHAYWRALRDGQRE